MKLAIMQPYFLPYIGYFQLISSVDKFIVYDDVSFIKGGWINRNRVLVQGKAKLITIPLKNGRSGVPIREVEIGGDRTQWSRKILQTVLQSYGKAPEFKHIYAMFEGWLSNAPKTIAEMNLNILQDILAYLNLNVELEPTSAKYGNNELSATDRVLDICRREGATHYVNAIGGKELYSHEDFSAAHLDLSFLKSSLCEYSQANGHFISGLSILDVLMFNNRETVMRMIKNHSLVK